MADKTSRAATSGTERRAYGIQLEIRHQSNGKASLDGYASVTGHPYNMWDKFGEYTETVHQGSFKRTLNARPETQLLLNHGGLSMAYTKAGSLRLAEDTGGLHIGAEVNANRSDVRDMLTAIEDGDVDEMSFAFKTTRQEWSPEFDKRDIYEVDIHRGDVSVVNFGANAATAGSLSLRSQDLTPETTRAMIAQLQRHLIVIDATETEGEQDDVPCPSCGALNADDAVYCDQCGAPMTQPAMAGASRISRAPLGLCLALAAAQG